MSELAAVPDLPEITTGTVPIRGKDFHVAERVGLLPMMKFAVLAKQGVDANEMEGLAATYELLQQCIHPAEWGRFERHATDERMDGDELMEEVVAPVMALLTARPSGRPSDSSDGPQTIEPYSTDGSSSAADAVIQRYNAKGRPDLALMVYKRQQSLTA